MQRLQRVAQVLKQHGQGDLAREAAEISLALKGTRTAAAGDFDRLFQDLVKVVDDFSDAAKKVDDANRALDAIHDRAQQILPKGSDQEYGFAQDVTWLRNKLNALEGASKGLESAYDELNSRALRYKMR